MLYVMTTDEELQLAVDALGESVLVVGAGAVGREVVSLVADSDLLATDTADSPDAVILAVDVAQAALESPPDIPHIPDAPVSLAAVTVTDVPTKGERAFLRSLTDSVGTIVLVSGDGVNDLIDAVATLVSIARDSGVVNIDLADVQTVFRSTDIAALGVGSDDRGHPADAVRNAFHDVPAGIETDSASGVIVDVLGTPQMTVGDISDAVSTVRERVGPDAHVIWGGSVDESVEQTLEVRLILAGVKNARVAPGDRCPRCETRLSTYALGDRTMPTCERCGFAGVSVRLRE